MSWLHGRTAWGAAHSTCSPHPEAALQPVSMRSHTQQQSGRRPVIDHHRSSSAHHRGPPSWIVHATWGSGSPSSWAGVKREASSPKRDLPAPSKEGSGGELASYELVGKMAAVKFNLQFQTAYGQSLKLLGSHPKLGSWNLRNAVEMRWTNGDVWVANVDLPAGGVYEYKYVLIDYKSKQALEWQMGSNAVLAVVVRDTEVSVYDNWSNAPGAMVKVDEGAMTRESKLQTWATEMMGYWKEARRLQIEMVHKNNEAQGLRNELSQLRMELSLERQHKQQAESQITDLQVENTALKSQLMQKTIELNDTLSEVLHLLDTELDEVEEFSRVEQRVVEPPPPAAPAPTPQARKSPGNSRNRTDGPVQGQSQGRRGTPSPAPSPPTPTPSPARNKPTGARR